MGEGKMMTNTRDFIRFMVLTNERTSLIDFAPAEILEDAMYQAMTLITRQEQKFEKLQALLKSLLPGVDKITGRSVESHLATGRIYLNVAGYITVVEGDVCRDPKFERVWTREAIEEIEEKFNAPIRELLLESNDEK